MKITLTIICLLFFGLTFAQEKDVKVETKAEREQRYIEEANPFRKNGYRPRIVTLSKGKYREAFPDTIVQVGSFTYNKKSKSITGFYIAEETKLSEATLRPDIMSRWMNPDPLSEEFPDWSPYNFVENNPIRFIDPEGLSPFDVVQTVDDKIKPTFASETAQSTTNEVVQNATGGKFTTTVTNDGFLELKSTGVEGPLTEGQQAFVDNFNEIANSEGIVEISISESNPETLIGNFATGDIDIDDVAKFGDGPLETAGGAFSLEIREQYMKQVEGVTNHGDAHGPAVRTAQNPVNGRLRSNILEPGTNYDSRTNSGVLVYKSYNNAGKNPQIVRVNVTNNNVTDVEQ